MKDIKRIITSRLLGYSQDYRMSYWVHIAELNNGKIKHLYSTDIEMSGGRIVGLMTEEKPEVERES